MRGDGIFPGLGKMVASASRRGAEGGQEVPHEHHPDIGGPRSWQGRVAPTT